jgi:branched-chain amino acid transport system permease protein
LSDPEGFSAVLEPSTNPFRFYGTLAALAIALPLLTGSYSTSSVVLVFAIAAAACNLLLGFGGILSFAQGSFFGVGSYTAGILLKAWPGLHLAALPASMLAGAVVAAAIGLLSTRQKGIYSVMITLAMAQLAFFAALSFPGLTGGENGLLDIPRPSLGLSGLLTEERENYLVIALAFLASLAFLARVIGSPFGRVLDAVRENDSRAETLGFHVQLLKVVAFALSGAITALAGALYALQLRSAPLSSIDLMTSESILIMAIVGGRRSIVGACFGALAMVLMGEMLAPMWPRWQMIVGFVLIAVVLFAQEGLGGIWRRLWQARETRRAAARMAEAP